MRMSFFFSQHHVKSKGISVSKGIYHHLTPDPMLQIKNTFSNISWARRKWWFGTVWCIAPQIFRPLPWSRSSPAGRRHSTQPEVLPDPPALPSSLSHISALPADQPPAPSSTSRSGSTSGNGPWLQTVDLATCWCQRLTPGSLSKGECPEKWDMICSLQYLSQGNVCLHKTPSLLLL